MKRPIVGFCVINLENGAREVKETLEKDPNIDVTEYGCIRYCGPCKKSLYALVDGEFVTGETSEQLIANIYQHLDEQLVF